MGRKIKRVPLDFDWPIGKVWDGFLNPFYKKCPHCDAGYTTAGSMLEAIVHLILIAGEDAKRGRLHPYLRHVATRSFDSVSEEMTELSAGLAGREPGLMGHDCCDQWSAKNKVIEAAGLDPKTWGQCQHCHGHAIDSAVFEQYESWKPTEPPAGEGWQVWETVTEGSPVTPVFATAESLIEHLATSGTSRAAAESFVKWSGWVPTMVMQGGKIYEGIESAKLQGGDDGQDQD